MISYNYQPSDHDEGQQTGLINKLKNNNNKITRNK